MSHRLRVSHLGVAAVAAAALVVPSTALARSTKVVPYKTIAGVPLKQTPKQVRKELGKPSHTIRVDGKIAEYDYHPIALSVQFDVNHHPDESDFVGVAVGFATPDIDYRTTHGIHIGSTRAEVLKAFGGSGCHFSLGGCIMWKGPRGATGSYAFGINLEQGKVASMSNQVVLNDL